MALFIYRENPHRDDIAHRDDIVGTLDVAIGHLADVYQTTVLQADVDEGTEIYHVENGALEFHTGLEVFEFENALLEDRRGQVFARITAGPGQSIEDVAKSGHTHLQPTGGFLDGQFLEFLL
jgi:hypothetical protein